MIDNAARKMEVILPEFMDFVGKNLLVSHNVDFDRWFLQREISAHNIIKRYKYECTLTLSRQAFPFLPNHKLITVASYLKINTSGAHRALRDCEMTLELYLAAKSQLPANENSAQKIKSPINKLIPALSGKVIIFTGSLKNFNREIAQQLAKNAGMVVKNSISKKISYVVVGDNPGANLDKAVKYDLNIINEEIFMRLLELDEIQENS